MHRALVRLKPFKMLYDENIDMCKKAFFGGCPELSISRK